MTPTHGALGSLGAAAAIGAGLLLLVPTAEAGNGPGPRTPVDWTGAPCMTIVDRSENAVVHLQYSIPMEDTEVTEDELEDSRTHQFFGFCRGLDPQVALPLWITQADVDRATDAGIALDGVPPQNILESNTELAGCWHRINADDDRRPITFAAAAEGVDWDTAELPAGSYVVEGYTWEPPLNIWSPRPGVIKVVDEPDPAASPPALGISNTEEVIDQDDTVVIEGCVSAEAGSTMSAYWALPVAVATWQPFVEDQPAQETFAIEFDPPPEAAGNPVMIRVDVTDPSGRSYTGYMRDLIFVLGDPAPPPECGGGFVAPECDDTGTSGGSEAGSGGSTSGTGTTSGEPGPGGADDASDGGCGGCGVREPGAPRGGLLLLGLLGLRRRRLRHPSRGRGW